MRTIVVDDEVLMLKRFNRLSKGIPDLKIVGQFECAEDALHFAEANPIDLAFLDVEMPIMNGIDLARALRKIREDMLIVFVSAYDNYLWDFNQVGGDYYIMKPYNADVLRMAMDRIRLMARRQQKELYIQTFGNFLVLKKGVPLPLEGKAKEILALAVAKRGKEISNEELYSIIWEGRQFSNAHMTVFYNALRRLKLVLKRENIEYLLFSTAHGQMVNTECFDCDYYAWQDKNMGQRDRFEGEFMVEYSWGEYILPSILNEEDKNVNVTKAGQ